MMKGLESFDFKITGSIKSVSKEEAVDVLDTILRDCGIVLCHIDVGNMSCYYPNGNEK